MIIAVTLMIPFGFSLLNEQPTIVKKESRAGLYQSIVNGKVDWLNLENSGNFILASQCRDYTISGKWKFEEGDLEYFTFVTDSFYIRQAFSHADHLYIWMPEDFGCQKGQLKMIKRKD